MKKLLWNKWFLLVVTIASGSWTLVGHGAGAMWATGLALGTLYQLLRCLEGERNWKAIQGALAGYEQIIGGRVFRGNDAEILASDRIDDPRESGPVRFEHICRTSEGTWFLFEVAVTYGRVVSRCLSPCDESMAKRRLERHQDAYIRCFGQPTVA